MTKSVLIIEDDENAREGYVQFLRDEGFETQGVGTPVEALLLAFANPPDIIVTDITLPGMSGFELAEEERNWQRVAEGVARVLRYA